MLSELSELVQPSRSISRRICRVETLDFHILLHFFAYCYSERLQHEGQAGETIPQAHAAVWAHIRIQGAISSPQYDMTSIPSKSPF